MLKDINSTFHITCLVSMPFPRKHKVQTLNQQLILTQVFVRIPTLTFQLIPSLITTVKSICKNLGQVELFPSLTAFVGAPHIVTDP